MLAAVFCLAAAALVAPLAMYGVYQAGVSQGELAAKIALPERENVRLMRPRESGAAASDAFPVASPDDPDARLQALIDKKNEQLEGQRDELDRKQQELSELRADRDAIWALLEELASEPVQPADATSEAASVAADGTADAQPPAPIRSREELQAELSKLREQLDRAVLAEAMLTTQIEEIRAKAALDSEAVRLAADQAISAERMLRLAATEALVESGDAGLPILILMLRDQQPAIRAFAADVLGAMGPSAGEAVTPLSDVAAADADERVREAARRALRAIRD
jgi:hypothetical protein